MEIKFRKKTRLEWSVLFVLVIPMFFPLLIDLIHLPDLIKYSIDIVWIALLFGMVNRKRQFIALPVKKLLWIVGVFFALTLVGFLLNFQSVFYYLWGIRNNIRMFVYFFACIFFLRLESVDHYLDFFDIVFWINVPISLYQYFALGLDQDRLGGIFGSEGGCNAYTNILFIIVITKSILYCLNNKETVLKCLMKCLVSVFIAALAELKVFYLELIVMVALAMFFSRSSYRKLWITVGAIAGIFFGIRLIYFLFPVFNDWFSFDRIWESVTSEKGYTSHNDMNRLTAVSIAMNRFLSAFHQKMFGLGLGNCDFASFDFLTTPFYKAYGGLNYVWFSSAMLVLETGLIGMGMYICFFVYLFLSCWKMSKDASNNVLYCHYSMICAVMCGFLFILNNSLRSEAGFMMFFALSLPFIRGTREEEAVEASNDTNTREPS